MKYKIPSRFLRTAPQKGTRATRNPMDGTFTGRKVMPRGNDTTKSRYLIKDTDLNHDGKIGPGESGGTIHGRKVAVKSSRRARGYERRV